MARQSVPNKPEKAAETPQDQSIDLNFIGSREEPAESRTLASRKRLHQQLDSDVAAFLAKGGKINKIDPHVTADPPRKPTYQYGQRPI